MRRSFWKYTGILLLLLMAALVSAQAQDTSTVRIAFDRKSKRIDLVTGKEIPDYTLVKRGSIQFFLGRLDEPDDFVNFTHDGFRKANISDLHMMEKVQAQFAIWRLRYKSGSKNTPRIQHLAVSFIPLSSSTGEPEQRVYVLLNDLELIDWGNEK